VTAHRIEAIAARFADMRRHWNLLRWLAPENAAEQKRLFFQARGRDARHTPRFIYKPHDGGHWSADREWLADVALPDGPLGELLREERDFLATELDMVASRGDGARFNALSLASYGTPGPADVKEALDGLAHVPEPPPDRAIAPAELAAMARHRLDQLGIAGWKVDVINHLTTIMKIDSGHRAIELRGDFTFGPLDVISLLHHEIDGHVVRAENGFALGHEFLGLGVGNETELDEGIACLFEDRAGGLVGRRYQELAARVVAVDLAQRADFNAVYDCVREAAPEIGEDLTYQMTLRVKRGLSDTAEPGGWTKDALYFTGLRHVRAHVIAHGEESVQRDLMAARVSWAGVPHALALRRAAGTA